jgi:hypothetical protein
MSGTLRFHSLLIEQASSFLRSGRPDAAIALLNRVLSMPALPPDRAADANYLLAQACFAASQLDAAADSLRQSLERKPDDADCHYLLAQALEQSDHGGEALPHYAKAVQLDPADGRKVASYARALARRKDRGRGVRLLQSAYADHASNPEVVETVVQGLVENDEIDEAELVAAQSAFRHGADHRFRKLREWVRVRTLEARLYGRARGSDGESEILAFRDPASNSLRKPGGAKRPNRDGEPPAGPKSHPKPRPASRPVALDAGMSLVEILRRSGAGQVAAVYENLGLIGKQGSADQIADIASAFAEQETLASIVRDLPRASRKLLKTLVQLGGYVPAGAVFQFDGPDAPPPDYLQPLVAKGLAYFGRSTKTRRGGSSMVVATPADLVGRLARVLKVKVEG